MPSERLLCTLVVDDELFGVDVLCVQEIIDAPSITRVPLAGETIVGLLNLRGEIVPVVSLRLALGLRPIDGAQQMHVVLVTTAGLASLIVDSVGDVVTVDDSTFEPPPHTVTGPARDLVRGVYKLEPRLLLELDVDRALAVGAASGGSRRG
jgi:purine-binding chemotaxis protein CheW